MGLLGLLLVAACSEIQGLRVSPYDPDNPSIYAACDIPAHEIFLGAAKDGIPALTDPRIVRPDSPEADYLADDDRVVGVLAGFDALAIPLRILRYHEIVNIDVAGRSLAVTHCPLTGSSLTFDREPLGEVEFGVSGLLFRNNLIMYDRTTNESLWPQMLRGARCGPSNGTMLTMYPAIEATWGEWQAMHPETWVISDETGFERDYNQHPYGDYDETLEVSWPVAIDARRHPKERVLGVQDDSGGVGYPFGELERLGPVGVTEHQGTTSAVGQTVIFWETDAQAAMAYSNTIDGTEYTFAVVNDQIVDNETGSTWRADGVSTSGPLAGAELDGVAEAYVAFWFAWAGFETEATLWEAP